MSKTALSGRKHTCGSHCSKQFNYRSQCVSKRIEKRYKQSSLFHFMGWLISGDPLLDRSLCVHTEKADTSSNTPHRYSIRNTPTSTFHSSPPPRFHQLIQHAETSNLRLFSLTTRLRLDFYLSPVKRVHYLWIWPVTSVAKWPNIRPLHSNKIKSRAAGKICGRILADFVLKGTKSGQNSGKYVFLLFFSLILSKSKKYYTFLTEVDKEIFF